MNAQLVMISRATGSIGSGHDGVLDLIDSLTAAVSLFSPAYLLLVI